MVSKPEVHINNSPMKPNPSVSTKMPITIKSLHQCSEILDVKHNTAIFRLGAAKEKHRFIRTGNVLWSNISKCSGHKKINQKVVEALYNWILHHPQVMQSTIVNYCLYVSIDANS